MAEAQFSVFRYRMWEFIRKKGTVSAFQMRRHLECREQPVLQYLNLLRKHGYFDCDGENFRLVKNTGVAAPQRYRDGLWDPNIAGPVVMGRQRIWNCLRSAHAQIPIEDVLSRAEVSKGLCQEYLRTLSRAGYVRVDSRSPIYFLVWDTGPFCPVPVGSKVFDQNLGKYTGKKNEQTNS